MEALRIVSPGEEGMNQTEISTANRTLLRRFIEKNAETLLGTLRYYVVRAGLADRQGATLAAVELLNEVTVEALEHADRFRPGVQPATVVSHWCETCIYTIKSP
jgi:hypothetical protein